MRTRILLTAVMILMAVAAASVTKLLPATPAAAPQPVTISIDGLHRQVNVRSLPELKIEDLY